MSMGATRWVGDAVVASLPRGASRWRLLRGSSPTRETLCVEGVRSCGCFFVRVDLVATRQILIFAPRLVGPEGRESYIFVTRRLHDVYLPNFKLRNFDTTWRI